MLSIQYTKKLSGKNHERKGERSKHVSQHESVLNNIGSLCRGTVYNIAASAMPCRRALLYNTDEGNHDNGGDDDDDKY